MTLVYVFQAALLCEPCGKVACDSTPKPDNEHTWDSDDYPKGPYPDGGGEADSPQHCDRCGVFLENPLTSDGVEYVLGVVDNYRRNVREWIEFYEIEIGAARVRSDPDPIEMLDDVSAALESVMTKFWDQMSEADRTTRWHLVEKARKYCDHGLR